MYCSRDQVRADGILPTNYRESCWGRIDELTLANGDAERMRQAARTMLAKIVEGVT